MAIFLPRRRSIVLPKADRYPGAMLVLDFVGTAGTGPAFKLNGLRTRSVFNLPGWTYTGGTPAGTGSYAPKADGSLQFFPSYTNLLTYSNTFTNGAWAKTNATVTTGIDDPFGGTSASRLTATAGPAGIYQTLGTSVTGVSSVWVRRATGTGNISMRGLNAGASAVITVTGTWQRFTSPAATGIYAAIIDIATSGDAIDVYGAQTELGSAASTYIPTTTAAVTVGTPRITDAGYWAEEARTNLLLRSQEFDNASWTKSATTVLADQTTAPDGNLTADKINETATTAVHYIASPTTTVTTATVYTHSVYLKAGERTFAAVYDDFKAAGKYFNLSAGTVLGNLAGAPDSATITSAGNGWWKCTITFTTATTSAAMRVYLSDTGSNISYAGTAGSGIYIWQADLQAGAFATSPIPTTSVAVTRAADVGRISGFTFGQTTLFADFIPRQSSASGILAEIGDGTSANRIGLQALTGSTPRYFQVRGGSTAGEPTGSASAVSVNTIGRMALRVASSDYQAAAQGALFGTASGVIPTGMTGLSVGISQNYVGEAPNATIRRIVIYPRAFGNAELQAVTA